MRSEITIRDGPEDGGWRPVEARRTVWSILESERQIIARSRAVMSRWTHSNKPVHLTVPSGFAIVDAISQRALPIGDDFDQIAHLHARVLRWSTGPEDLMRYDARPWRQSTWSVRSFNADSLDQLCNTVSPLRGMSFGEMRDALRRAGVRAQWLRLTVGRALDLIEPFVILLRAGEGKEEHFVLCRNATKGTIVVTDFPFPPKRLDEAWLRKHFQGEALVIGRDLEQVAVLAYWSWWRIALLSILACLLIFALVQYGRARWRPA